MEEIWKPIQGYEGRYEVSNTGCVKSLKYRNSNRHQILKPILLGEKRRRYYYVILHNKNKYKHMRINRLVAIAFVPNPLNLPQVNHIDNDPLNNNDWNLEWMTNRQNATHAASLRKRSSQYIGVSWHKTRLVWMAGINVNGKLVNLGRFELEIDAAAAYQKALIELTVNH
jgi:hypothetical protein